METFSVKFRAGNLDLSAMMTEYDHHQKFKVEMVTKEPELVLLNKPKSWLIIPICLYYFIKEDI